MEIAVLGGAGGVGRTLVADLLKESDCKIRIVDIRERSAKQLAQKMGPRVSVKGADASRPRTLARALKGVSAAVNCIGPFYRFAVTVARTLLDSGISGVDICDDYTPVGGLFALDDLAKRRGLTFVTGAGWSPGLTNALALAGARELTNLEEIRIYWAANVADYTGPAAVNHLLFTSTGDVPVRKNDKRLQVEALTETETVAFPPPVGNVPVSLCGHPEPITLPKLIRVPKLFVKGGIVPAWNNRAVHLAVRLGLTRDDRSIEKTARRIVTMEKLFRIGSGKTVPRSASRVVVSGWKHGSRKQIVFDVADRMKRLTALPASTAVLQVVRGKASKPGVFAPEGCLDLDDFFVSLARRGIVIQKTENPEK